MISNILKLTLPITLAQLINALYGIVDQVYVGMIPKSATSSLTGLGLCLPIISMAIAFTDLFGMGDVSLCSIEGERDNKKEAEAIMGNASVMMMVMDVLLTVLKLVFKCPMLYLFSTSDTTISCADSYTTIYLLSNIFVMTGLGINSFINPQRFGAAGMMAILSEAIANITLDPIFVSVFHMGARGAALVTILSQCLSTIQTLTSLTGKRAILRSRPSAMELEGERIPRIVGLGMSGFTMVITSSSVQVICNAVFQRFGGDLYVGIMTVINSTREAISVLVNGMTNNSRLVVGFDYGVGEYGRARKSIVLVSMTCIIYTVIMWLFARECPEFFIRIFNREGELVETGIPVMHVYFFEFFVMFLQFSEQAMFVGLGKSKKAVLFSIFHKVIIVVPLTLVLPTVFGLGTMGILMAKPMSSFIGDVVCFGTMLSAVRPGLKQGREKTDR